MWDVKSAMEEGEIKSLEDPKWGNQFHLGSGRAAESCNLDICIWGQKAFQEKESM